MVLDRIRKLWSSLLKHDVEELKRVLGWLKSDYINLYPFRDEHRPPKKLERLVQRVANSSPSNKSQWLSTDIWLVVWNMFFPYIGNVIISIDELMFFTGLKPPTRYYDTKRTLKFFEIIFSSLSDHHSRCGCGHCMDIPMLMAESRGTIGTIIGTSTRW